ncbi:NACHT domain-containing protein [Odoribacter laneus]|uniref:NACHT domain-containing protein n=1 Tax=Odoribacter laneus YIT 12061 TaxID=742817 RepID=H1DGC9_9BACT|nr:hypothetical protein [Odoribacter laneus]EHP48117.1 hypothetical protein HMPREF9449_01315 [Odoribacter laneus YIT 12061]
MIVETTAVVIYLADLVFSYYLNEEVLTKKLWHKFFPPKTFKKELYKIIGQTIEEYEKGHPYHKDGNKYPFYHSQIAISTLSKYILFNDGKNSVFNKNIFKENPNIIEPSKEEIECFYTLFVTKVRDNLLLKKLYVEENYKNRIYEIYGKLNIIEEKIDNIYNKLNKSELTPNKIITKLREQVVYQLSKQKNSGKYIPETFIETDSLKDQVRYFIAPTIFFQKLVDETKRLNFDTINRKYQLHQKEISFEFNTNILDININAIPFTEFEKNIRNTIEYLKNKYEELYGLRTNSSHYSSRKIEKKIIDFEYIISKILLLTTDAGQGKTNFLCDICENVLLKRDIPAVFLTGYEINAENIYETITNRLFPGTNYCFEEIMSTINSFCENKGTNFIFLIDGLNENSKPRTFSQNIEIFISEVLKYDRVKIILTCRTEYFKNNFSALLNATFKDKIVQIKSLNTYLEENRKKYMYDVYCKYFDVTIEHINEEIYEQLVDNFLLLRIFTEVYQHRKLTVLSHICKEKLFKEYYNIKSQEINKRLNDKGEYNILGNIDIRRFLKSIIEYMIENKVYENIPLDTILEKDIQNKDMYLRFLDENILVRKDLEEQTGIISIKEYINFTFDEFRDFLLTDYLVNEFYDASKEDFFSFIDCNINKDSRIKEGCSKFLFSMEREKDDEELSLFIKNQDWYKEIFPYQVFEIEDEDIIEDDKILLKKLFLSTRECAEYIWHELAYRRWNDRKYPNLNIILLFEIFNNLTDKQFNEYIYFYFNSSHNKKELNNLIDKLYEFMKEKDFEIECSLHNLYQYVLYLTPISSKARKLYDYYWSKHRNIKHLKYLLLCKSDRLLQEIHKFMEHHEIQL